MGQQILDQLNSSNDYRTVNFLSVPGNLIVNGTSISAGGNGSAWYVDGTNGADTNLGTSWSQAFATIGHAVSAATDMDVIYIAPKSIAAGGTDPGSYAETITIPAGKSGLSLIGVSAGTKQAAQPQVKKGSGSVAQLTVRSPGCLIQGITFNGGGATGGGILLDDDGSTKTAEGTIIRNCVLKNCVGSGATDGSTGGGVMIGSSGGCWDTLIDGCLFYNNIGGFVLLGTGAAVPQDITIRDCIFTSSTAAGRDCDIFGAAGSGMVAVVIQRCMFGIFPAAGTKNNYAVLTGCTGLLADCRFASSGKTFGAAANVLIPTTVGIAGNYQDGALIART